MQLIKESKQGKIKESWSVVQCQTKNKHKVAKALGDAPRHPEIEGEPCLRATERESCGSKPPRTHCSQLLRSPIPPCHLHTPGPTACRDAFDSSRLPQRYLLLIFTCFFCYLSDVFPVPWNRLQMQNLLLGLLKTVKTKKKQKRKKSEGKHKTERKLSIFQTERGKVKLQQWVAKTKSIELSHPSNTSLRL